MPTFVEPPESSGGGYSAGDDARFGTVKIADGSNSIPSLSNTGDTDTGIYFPAENNLAITTGGTQRVNVNSSGVNITGGMVYSSTLQAPAGSDSAPSITNSSDIDTGIYFPAADNVGITSGGTLIVDVRTTGVNVTGGINVSGTITGDTSLTLDSTTVTTAELGVLEGVTSGHVTASKALVVDSNKDLNNSSNHIRVLRIKSFGVGKSPTMVTGDITYNNVLSAPSGSNSAPSIAHSDDTDTGIYFPSNGHLGITAGGSQIVNVSSSGIDITGNITGDTSLTLDSTTVTTAELGVLDGVTAGSVTASKALVVDSNRDLNNDTSTINDLRVDSLGVGVNASGTTGEILAINNITAFSSDKRLKTNILPIQDPLSKLSTISGYTYRWNMDKCNQVGFKPADIPEVGVLAQEINEVLPEVIKHAPFDRDKDGNSASGDNYLTVQYEKLVPLLIECIKAQQSQIDELKVCLSKLK